MADSPRPLAGLEFGPFLLDPARRVLWRRGELVPLPPKALDVLAALAEQQGDVVTKDELMRRVWPDTFVEEANLSVQVALLRRTLGHMDDGRSYVETVARRGYRFAAPVRRQGPPTLAVLPFRALTPGPESEYLGIGMADALITRLAGAGGLVVRPTSAVLKYAREGVDPRLAGRELQARSVLDGRIQRDGSRLRVTVQLVGVDDAEPGWAEAFEADFTSLFEVQDALAARVASALALRLGAAERERLTRRPTADLEAYQAYVKGRYFWSRFTEESLGRAFACFQEASERDPLYALPHAGLADLQLVLGFSGLLAPREAWPLAASAARKALELDASVAEAHVSLGFVTLFERWDWDGAELGLERAVGADPNAVGPRLWRGLFLLMRGRLDRAEAEIERARALDPLSLVAHTLRVLRLYLGGDHAGELAQARALVELEPGQFVSHWSLGLACLHNGLVDEAIAAHRRALELAGGMALMRAVLARTLAVAGRPDEARAALEQMAGGGYVSGYQLATVELALGAPDDALASLERACEERDPWMVWLRVDPMLEPLRENRRFAVLAARIGP
jgi:DNA-binding winged helix-turn-helix (wHTH) protein/tetratricopeptide (TPR) repeat protein